MKSKHIALSIIFFSVLLLMPLQVLAEGAKATVEGQIDKILIKMKDPAFKELSKDAKLAEIRKIINEVFDYKELSKRTLGREWKKFKPEQQTEFIDLFSKPKCGPHKHFPEVD